MRTPFDLLQRRIRRPSAPVAPAPWALGARLVMSQLAVVLPVSLFLLSTRDVPLFSWGFLVALLAAMALGTALRVLLQWWIPEVTYLRYRRASVAAIEWRSGLSAVVVLLGILAVLGLSTLRGPGPDGFLLLALVVAAVLTVCWLGVQYLVEMRMLKRSRGARRE